MKRNIYKLFLSLFASMFFIAVLLSIYYYIGYQANLRMTPEPNNYLFHVMTPILGIIAMSMYILIKHKGKT